MEESGHVDVVGEGGGQAQDTDHALGALHLQNTMHIYSESNNMMAHILRISLIPLMIYI